MNPWLTDRPVITQGDNSPYESFLDVMEEELRRAVSQVMGEMGVL
jgi:hypothetical protein